MWFVFRAVRSFRLRPHLPFVLFRVANEATVAPYTFYSYHFPDLGDKARNAPLNVVNGSDAGMVRSQARSFNSFANVKRECQFSIFFCRFRRLRFGIVIGTSINRQVRVGSFHSRYDAYLLFKDGRDHVIYGLQGYRVRNKSSA